MRPFEILRSKTQQNLRAIQPRKGLLFTNPLGADSTTFLLAFCWHLTSVSSPKSEEELEKISGELNSVIVGDSFKASTEKLKLGNVVFSRFTKNVM